MLHRELNNANKQLLSNPHLPLLCFSPGGIEACHLPNVSRKPCKAWGGPLPGLFGEEAAGTLPILVNSLSNPSSSHGMVLKSEATRAELSVCTGPEAFLHGPDGSQRRNMDVHTFCGFYPNSFRTGSTRCENRCLDASGDCGLSFASAPGSGVCDHARKDDHTAVQAAWPRKEAADRSPRVRGQIPWPRQTNYLPIQKRKKRREEQKTHKGYPETKRHPRVKGNPQRTVGLPFEKPESYPPYPNPVDSRQATTTFSIWPLKGGSLGAYYSLAQRSWK